MNRYPTNLGELRTILGDEDKCIELMARIRWPHGFRCPHCRSQDATRLSGRPIWRCRECGRQTRLTAKTALHRTRISMSKWLQAIFTFAKKSDVSAVQLAKDLDVAETTATFILRRIRAFLDEPARRKLFRGTVEMGLLPLHHRDARVKPRGETEQHRRLQDLVVLVERIDDTPLDPASGRRGSRRWKFGAMRIAALPRGLDVKGFASAHCAAGKVPQDLTSFPITQTLLGNARAVVHGAFHGVSTKYLASYLRAFAYRFNRRDREDVLPVLMMRRLFRGQPCTRDEVSSAIAQPSLHVDDADVPPIDALSVNAPPPPPPTDGTAQANASAEAEGDELDRFFAQLMMPGGGSTEEALRVVLEADPARRKPPS